MRQRKLGLFVLFVLLALMLSACGQSGEPGTDPGQASGETCFDCHSNEEKLLADLAANPLPEKPKAESEGEG